MRWMLDTAEEQEGDKDEIKKEFIVLSLSD